MVPKDEDMRAYVRELNPSRWKVFQCLLLENENGGAEAGDLRDARPFLITDDEFKVGRQMSCSPLSHCNYSAHQIM